ncbi:mannose-ethanolamine phosphotransferase gpi13 [Podochytrium sp. JEL0797]|nr:mannose-ethanolamine phosphotransferase gpi13 [Podochytrium sp. JEL0797]
MQRRRKPDHSHAEANAPVSAPEEVVDAPASQLSVLQHGAGRQFGAGFLLARLELPNASSVSSLPPPLPRFSRAVVVLVDAFRFDFAVPLPGSASHFRNRLPVLAAKTREEPHNALLFRVRADPPTTTMQRLKALVTGTLPTFVDAGSNFGSSEITEDNIIAQMLSMHKRMIFMGDDTWTNLFPTQFNESHPFPSFNVQDLHTVDNGCVEHLMPALDRKHEWDFAVAHFLGVDHVGHSFGPDTVPMAEKLTQVNGWLTQVFEKVDNETLVVVLGDHGMDPKGDHGGDSENEVNAAMFLYSKQPLWESSGPGRTELDGLLASLDTMEVNFGEPYVYLNGARTMPQIDLVPTLASLLGVPIPFGNLGSVIPELFFVPSKDGALSKEESLLSVTRTNAIQMHRYLVEYSNQRMAADFSVGALSELFDKAETLYSAFWDKRHGRSDFSAAEVEQMKEMYIEYMKFMRKSLMSARRVWARFDVPIIIVGVATFLVAVLFGCFVVFVWWRNEGGISTASIVSFFGGGAAGAMVAAWTTAVKAFVRLLPSDEVDSVLTPTHEIIFLASIFAMAGFVLASVAEMVIKPKKPTAAASLSPNTNLSLMNGFLGLLLLILWIGVPASDSFTIYEESVTIHLLQAFGFYMTLVALNARSSKTRNKMLAHTLLLMLLTRFSQTSTVCREEKAQTCIPTFNAFPNSSVASPTAVFGLLAMIPITLLSIRESLRSTDSFNSTGRFLLSYGIPVGLCVSFIYWFLDTLHGYQQFVGPWAFMKIARVWLAKIGFLSCSISTLYVWVSEPTCLGATIMTKTPGDRYQVVLGLQNPLGASHLSFLSCAYMVLTMFQKPVGGIMLGVQMLQLLQLVELVSTLRDSWYEWSPAEPNNLNESKQRLESGMNPPTPYPLLFLFSVIFLLLGQQTYFSTGHQFTIASLQWEAAFIGLFETSFILAPVIMTLNTFGGPILSVLALPLIILWKQRVTGTSERRVVKEVGAVVLTGVVGLGAWGFCATALAGHFRRHLMVWSVYAPKFLGVDVGVACLDVFLVVFGVGALGVSWNSYRVMLKLMVEKGF